MHPPDDRIAARAVGMGEVHAVEYERSYGYQSEASRLAKFRTRVCIAGAGGGGGLLAEWAAREGYEVRVADPDVLERSNGGRLIHAVEPNFGRNKAEVVAEHANRSVPAHRVMAWSEGVTADNAEEFLLSESSPGQLIIGVDEIDILRPDIALMFARVARSRSVPVVQGTDIGFGGMVTTFHPNSRRGTFERVNGYPASVEPEQLLEMPMSLRGLAYLPRYGSLSTLLAVQAGEAVPTTVESVLTTTALCLSELRRITMRGERGHPAPTWAPSARWMDPDGRSGQTRHPTASHYLHLAAAVARDRLFHRNPVADYAPKDIQLRADRRRLAGEPQ